MYDVLKTLHILGVVILIGNVTVSAVWKVFADRTGDASVIGFAQRLITLTDWSLTLLGIILITAGGYGMTYLGAFSPLGASWLIYSQVLFAVSGAVWLGILVPLQVRLGRTAIGFEGEGLIPDSYRKDSTNWLAWGVVATVPLVAAVYLMVAKPEF